MIQLATDPTASRMSYRPEQGEEEGSCQEEGGSKEGSGKEEGAHIDEVEVLARFKPGELPIQVAAKEREVLAA